MEDDFIPDDDFQPDEPEMQGRIEKTGNFLENAIKNSGSFQKGFMNTATFGGTEIAGKLADKLVPLNPEAENKYRSIVEPKGSPIAEGVGSVAGFFAGPGKFAKMAGESVLPATAVKRTLPGFMARTASRATEGAVGGASLPGSLEERGNSAKVGAGLGVALGGISDLIFGRQAGLARKKDVGKNLGKMKQEISSKGGETDPLIISAYLDDILNSNKFETGISRTGIRNVKKVIDKVASEGRNLTAKELMQIEEQLGRVGIYQNPLTGSPMKDVSAPGLNQGAKESRNIVSNEVETLARDAGVKGFDSASQEYSNLAGRFPDKKPGGIASLMRMAKVGLISGAMGGQNAGVAGAVVDSVLENPVVKRGIYDLLISNSGKNIGRAGISFGASGMSKKS